MKKEDKKFYNSIEKLSPKSNLGKDNVYVATLKSAWKDKNVKNIAVMGPYGSGKSSAVRSFINSLHICKKRALYFSQESLFNYYKKTDETKGSKLSKVIYNELLKHDSNGLIYRRIVKGFFGFSIGAWIFNIFFLIFNMCLSTCAGILIYNFAYSNKWVATFSALGIFMLLLYLHFSYLLKSIKGNTGKFEFELTRKTNEDATLHPTFEENALINQFKKNRIRFVVIEDLERLKDNNQFELTEAEKNEIVKECLVEFKILSDLLSRSKIIRKKVCFIYGLNDGCFEKAEDRSKYFDFILNILPRVSSSNASQFLLGQEYLKEKDISNIIVNNVSVFIENERIANSLLAEFKIHSKLQNSDLDLNKVFVMCALNVIAPKFYKTLYEEKNVLSVFYSKSVIKLDKVEAELSTAFASCGLSDENLKKFLLMCINHKYIDRGYRNYLCIASSSGLTENDNEFYKLILARYHCFDVEIDEPEKLINFDVAGELFSEPNKFIISALITNKDPDKRKKIIQAIEINYDDETIKKYCSYLLTLDGISFNNIFKYISHIEKIYRAIVPLILNSKVDNNEIINLVVYYRLLGFQNNIGICDALIEKINTCKEFDLTVHIENDFFKVITKCGLIRIVDITSIVDFDSLEYIKASNAFVFNFNNLSLLYPEFVENPLLFLSSNINLLKKVDSFEKLFNGKIIEFNNDNLKLIFNVIKNLDEDAATALLNLEIFDNFRLVFESNDETEPYEEILISCNLLQFSDDSYDYSFETNDDRYEYLSKNIQAIIDKNINLSASWSELALNECSDYDFSRIINSLVSIKKVNNVNFIERYFEVYKRNKDSGLLQSILGKNPAFVFEKYSSKQIKYEEIEQLVLSKKSILELFNLGLSELYHLVLRQFNDDAFLQVLETNPNIYSDKIFVDETDKVISCENGTIVEWFILNKHHSFETKSYIAEASSDAILKKDFWITFLKSFGKVLNNKNIHIEKNLNNKRILDALFRAKVIKFNKEFKNLYSIKIL